MTVLRFGDYGPAVVAAEQDLGKAGYSPDGHAGDLDPNTFDPGMVDRVKSFQRAHHNAAGKPLDDDGDIGDETMWALKHQDASRIVRIVSAIPLVAAEIPIPMKAVKFPFYADHKVHTFWLAVEVADSFVEGIKKWEEFGGGQYVVTGTYRTVAAQAAAKKAKPTQCTEPGWSMHAHGRAVDGHFVGENPKNLPSFYEHMMGFRFFTIFNFPGKPIVYQSHELWHIECRDNPAIGATADAKSHVYFEKWAAKHGGKASLLKVVKQEIK